MNHRFCANCKDLEASFWRYCNYCWAALLKGMLAGCGASLVAHFLR